ncbi:MAG: leucine-rich repeat domain-containing protein [Oscillibacter sp.]|nr:leucine-rich repeat domain-containing protein [Oscillibacter sp.]
MKKRRICTIALVLVLLLCQIGARADGGTSGTCGEHISWFLDGGVLVLDGEGETYEYGWEQGYAPWFPLRNQIRSARVEGEITALNGVLFNGCEALTEISLPASLERLVIADQYDRWPDSIASVSTAADSVNYTAYDGVLYARSAAGTEYASGADGTKGQFCLLFYPPAKQDTALTLRTETEAVLEGAFYRNPYLTRLTLNDGLTRVPKLYRFTALKEISIPDSVTALSPSAFEGCSSLLAVDLPKGVREIPSFAFYGCSSLSRMDIPSTVATVYTSAFWLCDALNPITIPASVRTVKGSPLPGSASPDLTRYKDWYFEGDVPDIQNWSGGVMRNADGGMVPVGDRIHYWEGGQGWTEFIRSFQYDNSLGKSSPRTVFTSYGAKPVLRTVVWLNGDGSVLDSASYTEGEAVPAVTAKVPTKAPADGYTFTFSRWDEGTVTEAVTTYRPIFTSVQADPHLGQVRVIYRPSAAGERLERWYDPGTEITLPANFYPAPRGQRFRAWAIWNREYQPGDKYTVTEDVFVTARWDDVPGELSVTFRCRLDGVEDESARYGPVILYTSIALTNRGDVQSELQRLIEELRGGEDSGIVRQYPDYTLTSIGPDQTDYDPGEEVTVWLDYRRTGGTIPNASAPVVVCYLYCDQSGQMTGLDVYETTRGQVGGIHSQHPPAKDAYYVKTVVLSNDGNYVPVLPGY